MLSEDGSPCLSPRSPSARECCESTMEEGSLLLLLLFDFWDSLRVPNSAVSMEEALKDEARRNSDDTAVATPATVKVLTLESNESLSPPLGLITAVGDTPRRSTWSKLCLLVLLATFLVLVLELEVKPCPPATPAGSLLDTPR